MLNNNSDNIKLVEELRIGNKLALQQLFERYYNDLCFYANSFVRNFELSRDLVQDIFLKMWEDRKNLPEKLTFESYIYRSVKNRCLDHLKKEMHQDKYRSFILQRFNDDDLLQTNNYELKEILERIDEVLKEFPELTYKIFDLSRNKGYKNREIAEELDISIKTVESHISKALKILRTQLKDYIPEALILMLIS